MKKTLKFVAGLLTGIGLGLGISVLKREADRAVAQMTSIDPDVCKGFEGEDFLCINTGGVTCFLLKGENGYLLIDTGYAKGWETFCSALDKAGIAMDEIKAFLITHYHYDHTGFAGEILTKCAAQLIIHRHALKMFSGDMAGYDNIRPLNFGVVINMMLFLPVVIKDFKPTPLPTDDAILIDDDSTVLRDMGFDADILITPGHSPDSLTVMTGDKCAFVGDLMMSVSLVENMHLRPILHTGEDVLFASWRKLLDAGVQVVYPAHGRPVRREQVEEALALLTRG